MEYEDGDWIGMEEDGDGVHTAACPYCGDMTCWCHTSADYHATVIQCGDVVSDEAVMQAYAFFGLDG